MALPVEKVLPELLDALRHHSCCVLQAPPGAGKTTLVPEALLRAKEVAHGVIVLLQPRRVAARSCANYIASRLGEKVGQTVGLHIRHERKVSGETRLIVMTEGVLTQRFKSDPFLEGVSCVVLDEFHERSIHSDLALAFMKELRCVRDDLKIIVMSATLRSAQVSAFLDDCPSVSSEGRQFPLEIKYLLKPDKRAIHEKVTSGLRRACQETATGDILVFLPGIGEIARCEEQLAQTNAFDEYEVLTFHGSLSKKEQDRVMHKKEDEQSNKKRRIILCTNIAETSITVPDVRVVIDSGEEKRIEFDPKSGLESLRVRRISHESADQRAGRAGRLGPGVAYRLWTQNEHGQLHETAPAEIMRVDLSDTMMALLHFRPGDPLSFPYFERPPSTHIELALARLRVLGALDDDPLRLSGKGREWLSFPLPYREAIFFSHIDSAEVQAIGCLAGAILGEQDFVLRTALIDAPSVSSDLVHRLELFMEALGTSFDASVCRRLGVTRAKTKTIDKARRQLMKIIGATEEIEDLSASTKEKLQVALLQSYPDRLCRRRQPNSNRAVMVGGGEVILHETSGVRDAPYFLALQLRAREQKTRSVTNVVMAAEVPWTVIEEILALELRIEETARWNSEQESVSGVEQMWYQDLLIRSIEGVRVSDDVLRGLLKEKAIEHWPSVFQLDEQAEQRRERLRLAAEVLPGEWPDVDDQSLQQLIDEAPLSKYSFDAVRKIKWMDICWDRLPYEQQQRIEKELPETLAVPSGSRIRLDYRQVHQDAGAVILPVRIQEIFGWTRIPPFVDGKVKILLHLLAPNYRPAQVTQDLGSFWENTYPDVKKELRRRYPKHAWPDDPLTATPEKRPNRHRKT